MSKKRKPRKTSRLDRALRETREYLTLNGDEEATDSDALDHLMDECGQIQDGSCLSAGTEYCDFECAFRGE